MRVLVLARHAKAEAHTGALGDFERTLALRGRTDARELGAALVAADFEPDVAYISEAVRTSQTWELASTAWEVPVVDRRRDLYNASVATLVELVAATEPGASNVIVVGHEPTMSSAALFLAGPGSSREAVHLVSGGIPTGVAAVLEYDGEWPDLAARTARLVAVVGRSE